MFWIHTYLACGLCIGAVAPLFPSAMKLPTDLSQKAKPATVKVLIDKEQNQVLLEATGRYLVYDPLTTLEIGSGSSSKRAPVVAGENGIRWKELFPGAKQIRVVPGDSQSSLLVNGIEYRGCVEIYEVAGKLNIINEIDVERYLKSTLAFQIPNDLDEEVIDALAIVARTQVYAALKNRTNPYYDVEAQSVAYQGHALTLQNVALDKAVQRTKHVILTYQNEPFAATWTPNCAGKTADYASIFRKNIATPRGVEAPLAAHERLQHAWSFAISKQDLAQLIGAETIREIDLYQEPISAKVYAVRIKTDQSNQDINFFKLKNLLGEQRLRSNDFTVKLSGNQIIFTGFGEGHGVGLCLFSAMAMAENGVPAQKILSSFFPDTRIEPAYHLKGGS